MWLLTIRRSKRCIQHYNRLYCLNNCTRAIQPSTYSRAASTLKKILSTSTSRSLSPFRFLHFRLTYIAKNPLAFSSPRSQVGRVIFIDKNAWVNVDTLTHWRGCFFFGYFGGFHSIHSSLYFPGFRVYIFIWILRVFGFIYCSCFPFIMYIIQLYPSSRICLLTESLAREFFHK